MDILNLIGSIIVLIVAVPGILFSSFVVYLFVSGSSDKTSFNVICLTRAVNNIIVLVFNFLVITFPSLLLSYNYLPISLETLLILSTVNIYVANDVLTILVAINRFIAMFAPFYYDKLCSIKVTAACISLIYLNRVYATMTKSYNLFDGGCRIYTSLETFATTYEDPSCKKTSDNGFSSFDVLFGAIGFLGIALILNLFTFSKILRFYLGKNGQRSKETSMSIRKNIRMFFQTVLQDSLFLIDVLFTYKFSTLSKARIWLFISIILVWESIYMLDGFIMLMFSDKLSTLKSMFVKKKLNSIERVPSEIRSVNPVHSLAEVG